LISTFSRDSSIKVAKMSPAGEAFQLLSKWSESGQKLQVKFKGSFILNLSNVSLRTVSEQRFDFVGSDTEFTWFSTFGLAIFSVKDGVVRVGSGDDQFVISVEP
jgi:hypothetical protein